MKYPRVQTKILAWIISIKIKMKTIITTACVIVAAVIFGFFLERGNEFDGEMLKASAYQIVEEKTEGVWDRKIEITQTHISDNAAIGTWASRDVWHWIAWREELGSWNILVSLDGFDCDELREVPDEYDLFFSEVTHAPSGEAYCYAHNSR